MNRLIFAGLFTEGSTDIRFLESIVKKTIDNIAFECSGNIETELLEIHINKAGLGFTEQVLTASRVGTEKFSITLLCVHTDSDAATDIGVFENKITPAKTALENPDNNENEYCKILVTIVPVQMTEAWMLADKILLKEQIGTSKTDKELGINKTSESFSDPKKIIEDAIRIARQDLTKKRRKELTISELYLPIGQQLDLKKLDNVASYQKFKENLRDAFRQLNFLY